VAEEGDFSLEPYPALRRWLQRVQAEENHLSMSDATGQQPQR
jgi:hypothetical protein